MSIIKQTYISTKKVWPIIEGGKGIAVSDGISAGNFAAAEAVGTFSGANAKFVNVHGEVIPLVYTTRTRRDRHQELIEYSTRAAISQAKIARDICGEKGCIHMNVLWEMGAAQTILHNVLAKASSIIDGITCGAGMPYKLAEIATQYKTYYYPIISSMRALRTLWRRAYHRFTDYLGGVVYEDPWLAGGHNGLSNDENYEKPISPTEKLRPIRQFMNEVGLKKTILIIAGGVWYLRDWKDYIDNPEFTPIGFQFGTRPLLTHESQISDNWKQKLLTLKKGDVLLNRFSPTGFYSSAVRNAFIRELEGRSKRQVHYMSQPEGLFIEPLAIGPRKRIVYLKPEDKLLADAWIEAGYTEAMKTPDSTLIFLTPEKAHEIHTDQINCMGCLSKCRFSNWQDHGDYTTHKKADPRSFCIQKTLQNIIYRPDVENELMFSGHNAYKFSEDPFYRNGHIPTIKELVARILTGN